MPEIQAMRCQSCGQGWQLHKTDEFNLIKPTFCPICGIPTLERDKSAMGTNAKCFAGVSAKLVELLYQTWRLNPEHAESEPMTQHKRFLDFLHEQLALDD